MLSIERRVQNRLGFPNKQFKNGDEYHAFGRAHNVWGKDAYDLKKQLDKKTYIPEPNFYEMGNKTKKQKNNRAKRKESFRGI